VRRLAECIPDLPLPLAQLARRTLNAKSSLERHHNAYYLAEAALKLAAAARIGIWLDRCLVPGSTLAQDLEALVMPSTGHWRGCLERVDASLAKRKDAALLPLGDVVGHLTQRRDDLPAVDEFAHQATVAEVVSIDVKRSCRRQGLLGFFALLVSYRNQVLGHSATRTDGFYRRFGPLLAEATAEVLADRTLLGGLRLACAEWRETATSPELRWRDLTGLMGVPLQPSLAPDPAGAVAGRVYLVAPGAAVPLYPLVVFREDDRGGEAVGFLNKTARRVRDREGQRAEVIKRADYLDYATGEIVSGVDAAEAMTALLGRLRGQRASEDDRRAAEDASVLASGEAVPEETVAEGALLGGFEIEGELGRGGMGIVYRAQQRTMRRTVALKVLPPSIAGDELLVARFRREISALARCDHPNVVKVLTSGVDDDRWFYAMEFVDGADLAGVGGELSRWRSVGTRLDASHLPAAVVSSQAGERPQRSSTPQPGGAKESLRAGEDFYERLAALVAGAADGVAHLHAQGVIHRDIKPSNLVLTRDGGRLVVMDLGLARLADASRDLTASGTGLIGTIRYLPPEAISPERGEVDHRLDVYGLGATLYELVTGHPIHDGETEATLVHQVLHQVPVAPRRLVRGVPPDLDTIIAKATARHPDDRYGSMKALAEDLRAFAEHRPISARRSGVARRVRLLARRSPGRAAALLLVVLALLVASGAWWNSARDHTRYAANFAERWGGMEPVGQLSAAVAAGRALTHQFLVRRGRVERVTLVNSSGFPPLDEDAVAWELRYDQHERAVERVALGRHGRVVEREVTTWDLDWPPCDEAGFTAALVERKDRFGKPLPVEDTDVSAWRRCLDPDGFVVREHNVNQWGAPRPDEDGQFGRVFERDERGLVTRWVALGADGEPAPDKHGTAARAWTRDRLGNAVLTSLFDEAGALVPGSTGCAAGRSRYDDRGNWVEWSCLGVAGEPVLDDDGVASTLSTIDAGGNVVRRQYFDTAGEPTWHEKGMAGGRCSFDARGYRVEESFYGPAGEPATTEQGYAMRRWTYDDEGNLVEESFHAADGQPALGTQGFASIRYRIDARGRVVRGEFRGLRGEPVFGQNRIAGWATSFDAADNAVEGVMLGLDGGPVVGAGGYARVARAYDARGNIIETSFFGPDGAPITTEYGFAGYRDEFDDRGNPVLRFYLGAEGEPTHDSSLGVWGKAWETDDHGNEVRQVYLDATGQPMVGRTGLAEYRPTYDRYGRLKENRYFDDRGQPVLHAEWGIAGARWHHDDRGCVIRLDWLGLDGEPAPKAGGSAAGWTAICDARGNVLKETWIDVDGAPTAGEHGYTTRTYEYDRRGRETAQAYFDSDGAPYLLPNEGYATRRAKLDVRGREVEVTYFGVDGELVSTEGDGAGFRVTWDPRGNRAKECYLGPDGALAALPSGPTCIAWTYDERGDKVGERYFDAEGRPVRKDGACASLAMSYDARGNQLEQRCFDAEERPALDPEGRHGWRAIMTPWGEETGRVDLNLESASEDGPSPPT
jgi:serine/threonine protein kinase